MDVCEYLIVEHEGEALLDSGLGGLPVVESARALVHIPHKARVPPSKRRNIFIVAVAKKNLKKQLFKES